jgi:hypothetical protein
MSRACWRAVPPNNKIMQISRKAQILNRIALAALTALPACASIITPEIHMTVGEQSWVLVPTLNADNLTYGFGPQGQSIGNEEFVMTLTPALDPDPSIAYGLAVVDLGAPSTFAFTFFTPIVATGSPNIVNASISGALTDFTGDGVSMSPVVPNTTIQQSSVLAPLTSMGVDVGPAFTAGPGAPGALYIYGPFSAGPISGPAPGPWTGLEIDLSFTLSGGGDVAALTGFTSIEEAPVSTPDGGAGLIGLSSLVLASLAGGAKRKS